MTITDSSDRYSELEALNNGTVLNSTERGKGNDEDNVNVNEERHMAQGQGGFIKVVKTTPARTQMHLAIDGPAQPAPAPVPVPAAQEQFVQHDRERLS